MSTFYSAKSNGFYNDAYRSAYEEAGTWPDDAIALTEDKFNTLQAGLNNGKSLAADKKGKPVLTDTPTFPAETQSIVNSIQRNALISDARRRVMRLQAELVTRDITDDDRATMSALLAYIDALNEVDIDAPDWPPQPD